MKTLLSLFCVFIVSSSFAQETSTTQTTEAKSEASAGNNKYETVVEGTAFNSTSKVILDQEAIRKAKAPNILALLNTQANIAVSNSNIQPGSLFLRGGDSSHILILVDGLPFYDAATTARTTNLNNIDVKSVRRIEIIKGSQSVLYGGQALSGVIKIETLPQEIEDSANGLVEVGQYEYKKMGLSGFKALNENQGVLARAQVSEKNGRSPVLESGKRYWNRVNSADVAHVYRGDFDSYVKISQASIDDDLVNSAAGTGIAEDINGFKGTNKILGAAAGLKGKAWPLAPQLLVGYQNFKRQYQILPTTDLHYGSDILAVRLETTPVNVEGSSLKVGLSHTKENFVERSLDVESSNAFYETQGVFAKLDQDLSKDLVLEVGARADFAAHRDRVDSYQAGLTIFQDWKLEYATGFKTPSLYQMNAKQYLGSPSLKPEKAQTYSLTYEKEILTESGLHHFFSATAFEASFNNPVILIGGGAPGSYYTNLGKTQTRGVEGGYSLKKQGAYRFDFNIGYQEPWDVKNARWLHRRALHSGSVRLTLDLAPTEVGAETIFMGDRIDTFTGGVYTMRGYIISNVFATHAFGDQITGYVRGSNLENVRFESARGYHDEGTFWLAGAEISL